MDRYIGIDVHAKSSTVAVVDASGKRVGEHVVETNGQALVECLRMIRGQRHVCIEEGTQSGWLYEILTPHAQQMVVTNVRDSRGQKSDQRDAFSLAEKLRVGAIEHRVYKEVGAYRKLRELGRVHAMVVRDSERLKTRVPAPQADEGPVAAAAGDCDRSGRGANRPANGAAGRTTAVGSLKPLSASRDTDKSNSSRPRARSGCDSKVVSSRNTAGVRGSTTAVWVADQTACSLIQVAPQSRHWWTDPPGKDVRVKAVAAPSLFSSPQPGHRAPDGSTG